jgi:hypothetical protein
MLKWAIQQGCDWDNMIIIYAAQGGHLEIIKWAKEYGCSWTIQATKNAAAHGHLEVLKWLVENGCPSTSEHKDLIKLNF